MTSSTTESKHSNKCEIASFRCFFCVIAVHFVQSKSIPKKRKNTDSKTVMTDLCIFIGVEFHKMAKQQNQKYKYFIDQRTKCSCAILYQLSIAIDIN